jgi:cellulose biosynthesis protein BcsQ
MMKGKVFTMASAKGGSGKTVLTATFATFLTDLGKKVLIIDADSTTNGLTLMYLKEVLIEKENIISRGKIPSGIFDDSKKGKTDLNIIQLSTGIHLIPATFSFDIIKQNTPDIFFEYLEIRIFTYRNEYDYIFIDAQAGSDYFASIAISKNISDEVIIVSEYDPLSAAGVERLKGIFREDLTYNRTWYLLNKMIPEFIQSFSDFLEIAKYLNPIPWDADVVKAYARRKLPLDLENGNEFTLAIIQTLKTLLGEEISIEIESWKALKEGNFKKPIDEQYHLLEARLASINKKELKQKRIKALIISFMSLLLLFFIVYLSNSKLSKFESISIFMKNNGSSFMLMLLGFSTIISIINLYKKSDSVENIEKEVIMEKLKKLGNLKYSNFDSIVRDRKKDNR